MKKISEIISKITDRFANLPGYQRAWIEKNWSCIVGITASQHSRIGKIENEILYVYVDSSVWNQALFMQKRQYLTKIQEKFKNKTIIDIKYLMDNKESSTNLSENDQFVAVTDILNQFINEPKKREERRILINWDQLILYRLRNRGSSGKK